MSNKILGEQEIQIITASSNHYQNQYQYNYNSTNYIPQYNTIPPSPTQTPSPITRSTRTTSISSCQTPQFKSYNHSIHDESQLLLNGSTQRLIISSDSISDNKITMANECNSTTPSYSTTTPQINHIKLQQQQYNLEQNQNQNQIQINQHQSPHSQTTLSSQTQLSYCQSYDTPQHHPTQQINHSYQYNSYPINHIPSHLPYNNTNSAIPFNPIYAPIHANSNNNIISTFNNMNENIIQEYQEEQQQMQDSKNIVMIEEQEDNICSDDSNNNNHKESSSSSQNSSSNSNTTTTNSDDSDRNQINQNNNKQQHLQRQKEEKCQIIQQSKRRINKDQQLLQRNQKNQKYNNIPQYRILPVDYDDLPINEFHLYNDILISLYDIKQNLNNQQDQIYSNNNNNNNQKNAMIQDQYKIRNERQVNFICQWKQINHMIDSKRELKLFLSNKTETNRNFDSIIKLLKVRNQSMELGMLLIQAESRLQQIQNSIKESFNLMRQNGMMKLYQERRQLFEKKCDFFLNEISPQKKYMFVKSYYNEEKCEIEDSEMGVSAKLVELLTAQEIGLMIYKLMRGNYPEIFGNKVKELWSKQSVMRMLNLEQNMYNECIFENMELTTMDGFIFPVSMIVRRVQFKYDNIYAHLPLQDKFLYIEFNINPKVIQQINKLRKENQISCGVGDIAEHARNASQDINGDEDAKDLQQKVENSSEDQDQNDQNNKNNNNTNNSKIEGDNINPMKIVLEQKQESNKNTNASNANANNNNKKLNAFAQIKSQKKKKDRGFIEENEKDFYYEMQSQVFLDKFYDFNEIQDLYKQSEDKNNNNNNNNNTNDNHSFYQQQNLHSKLNI